MGTTQEEIRQWLERGKKQNATHVVVVCDTYDWEDYPVFVTVGQDVHKTVKAYSKDMQKVMEVYNLNMDLEIQLREHRSMNF